MAQGESVQGCAEEYSVSDVLQEYGEDFFDGMSPMLQEAMLDVLRERSAKGGGQSFLRCHVCEVRAAYCSLCSACGSVAYCGKQCQRADWRRHKPECKKRPKPASSNASRPASGVAAERSPPNSKPAHPRSSDSDSSRASVSGSVPAVPTPAPVPAPAPAFNSPKKLTPMQLRVQRQAANKKLIAELEDQYATFDLTAPPQAVTWTTAQIREYFESDGEVRP